MRTTETTTQSLTPEQKEKLRKAEDLICGAFSWAQSSSGNRYWSEVCDKILDLAKQVNNEYVVTYGDGCTKNVGLDKVALAISEYTSHSGLVGVKKAEARV